MAMALLAVCLSIGCCSGAAVSTKGTEVGHSVIVPALEPSSDSKFFGKDYPRDKNPKVSKAFPFKFSYPNVQTSHEYDRDFVKDENGDGGFWEAQAEYDRLRTQARREEKDVEKAKKEKHEREDDLEKAKEKEQKVSEEESRAEQETDRARDKVNEVEKATNATEKERNGVGKQVKEASTHAAKEAQDLEGCKQQLAEAKKKLEELLEEQRKRDAEKSVLDEQLAAEKSKQAAAEAADASLAEQVAKQTKVHAEAQERYNNLVDDLKEQEETLEKARKQLRIQRGEAAKEDERLARGAAAQTRPLTLAVALAASAAAVLAASS